MDIIETMKTDKAYIKYKLIVKNWEKEFKSQFSRTPSKFDIKEAPSNIKYAYKKYFQLKSAALENSLSICDIDEDLHDSVKPVSYMECIPYESFSPQLECSSESDQLLSSLPSGQALEKLLSNAQKKGIQKNVNTQIPLTPFTDNLSKKLFQNSKFSLRNPRKFMLPKLQPPDDKICGDKENITKVLPNSIFSESDISYTVDNESICNKTICSNVSISNCSENTFGNSSVVRLVNEEWLERAIGVNDDRGGMPQIHAMSKKSEELEERYGIRNIKVPSKSDKITDYVENSESEVEDNAIDRLKPALKKRKITENHFYDSSEAIKNVEMSCGMIKKATTKGRKSRNPTVRSLESRDQKRKNTSSKNHEISQQPPDIAQYLPFGLEEDITPRHNKSIDILKTVVPPVERKNLESINIERLESKIANGSLNDNFVKINIEKKVFVRGKKNFKYSKYKKQQWKDKKALHASMEFPTAGKISCFKCGATGHMARYCTSHKGDTLLPLETYHENEIPTLEDMQNIVAKEKDTLPDQLKMIAYESSPIPDSFLKMLAETPQNINSSVVNPIYTNHQQDAREHLLEILSKFGHKTFRPGQEEAIMRILCGMSTLLILSTGRGKSLCYQLPAYIYSQHYKCITLVISPLVSLMDDQVLGMPEFLKAGCLHTNQPPTHRSKIIQCLKDGEINILLISPEALISGDASNGFAGLFKSLPKIAFACIDEAHCVSQWSHNFRPSYLMICRVLREKLNVKCILGLTATASQTTIKSVVDHINIPDGLQGVITNPTLPDNLCLSVSFEKNKDRALISFLNSEKVISFNSIIVYCIRRDECQRVAALLRSCLQVPGKINMEKQNNKRKRMSYIAEAYHAGMSGAQRKKIQKHFMDGTLRIIVATVAFGMGINKSNIRCIIHYNMPSSFESYVQEVGRAGRDDQSAYCHVFMNNSNTDKNELLKHIHANTIDRPTIRKLLEKVFICCQCSVPQEISSSTTSKTIRCKGHEVGIPIDSTVEELDLPLENISTLLCYVELHSKHYIKVLNNAYTMCKVSSYGGPDRILEAAKKCPPLAMAYLLESKRDQDITKKSILEFHVIEVAAAIGWESGMTKYQLKNLEWITESGTSKRSHLKVEFNTLGFRIKAPGDLSPSELDAVLDDLHNTVLTQEKTMLYQLEESNKAFRKFGNYSFENSPLSDDILLEKSNELKHTIRNYFNRDNNIPTDITLEERPLDTERVISDVHALISSYKDCNFTGRSIVRIFQGISSPNYPALVWGRCKFWRSHIHEDFYGLIKIATQQVIQKKML